MRYTSALLLAGCLSLATITGCNSKWWQDFTTNPVHQTNFYLDTAQSVLEVGKVVFSQLKPLLPGDKQTVFQEKFDGSVVALTKAMAALRVAVKAAAESQEDSPDLTQVTTDVIAAIDHIKGVIDEVRGLLSTPMAAGPDGGVSAPALTQDPNGYSELEGLVGSVH